jgi:hypothetical protein
MQKGVAVAVLGLAGAMWLGAEDLQGTLSDWNCTERMAHDGRARVLQRDRSCSLVRNPERKSYGLITDDNRYFQLDEAGSRLAKELLNNSHDRDNLHVVVRGKVEGKTMKVETMSIL